jgi:hypothetical protein
MAKKGRGRSTMDSSRSAKPNASVSAADLKAAARRALAVIDDVPARSDTAVTAVLPDAVLALTADEREQRVRRGADTVLLDEIDASGKRAATRGFVKAVLRVPLDHPSAQVYGVWVEVDKSAYLSLKLAHKEKQRAQVWGTLATRLPLLEDAFGAEVEILEDGSELRARVTAARHQLLEKGPAIGPA